MESEFGVQATWTADAVGLLGAEYAIPAACKGSASPAVLDWLAAECRLRPEMLLTDVGGGLGGPTAFAARHHGIRPLVLEPMVAACAAATQLFSVSALACEGARLPLADESADAVWCLGVLCTTSDKTGLVEEIARIMKPGAALGLLVFTSDQPQPPGAPEGNEFPSEAELPGLLDRAGLEITGSIRAADLPADDRAEEWDRQAAEVQALVERLHTGDPRLSEAQEQERRIGRLIGDGVVRANLLAAVRR
ncbi:class I SAM-dependent methyltransferase [Kineosporia rhizophila]|uniref:class I SAM-dependent methyltransferase n=1 Tax=Kineosporia TaxID=49184 RepID=UPI001E3A2967|nr:MULTISPECIES: class I SAM-dependent methyltransferase [Kineosporia]MCE0537095.1 class I SAM-dependent methyltransferase [Kineosporia rhizophila]